MRFTEDAFVATPYILTHIVKRNRDMQENRYIHRKEEGDKCKNIGRQGFRIKRETSNSTKS